MELDANFSNVKRAVETAILDLDIKKTEYAQVQCSWKKKAKSKKEKGANPNTKLSPRQPKKRQ